MKTNIGIPTIFTGAIALMTLSGAVRAGAAESWQWQTSAEL